MKHNKNCTDTFSAYVSLNDDAKRNLLLYLKLLMNRFKFCNLFAIFVYFWVAIRNLDTGSYFLQLFLHVVFIPYRLLTCLIYKHTQVSPSYVSGL